MAEKNWKDYQLHFDYRIANEYGLEEAVVINKFQLLIESNKLAGRNYYQGRTWTFNSYQEWVSDSNEKKKYFPCFSPQQMRRILDSLIDQKVLIKGNFNKRRNDKTNWYAFFEEEIWIEAKSPISNYGSDRPDGFTLPESADQKDNGFFDQNTLPDSAEQNITLPESADQKDKVSAGIGNETAENDRSISQNRQNDAPESANHYHQSPLTSFKVAKEVNDSADIGKENNSLENPTERLEIQVRLTKLEVIQCVSAGYADKLAFNFSDPKEVTKRLERLFRMFVGMDTDKYNEMNVKRIGMELIDLRDDLPRKICWLIIEKTFAEYPGWNKNFKNISSIEGKIQKQKDRYIQDLHTANKNKETSQFREEEKQSDIIEQNKFEEKVLSEAKNLLQNNSDLLEELELSQLTEAIQNKMIMRIDRIVHSVKIRNRLITEEVE